MTVRLEIDERAVTVLAVASAPLAEERWIAAVLRHADLTALDEARDGETELGWPVRWIRGRRGERIACCAFIRVLDHHAAVLGDGLEAMEAAVRAARLRPGPEDLFSVDDWLTR